jgi:hypothetical protein
MNMSQIQAAGYGPSQFNITTGNLSASVTRLDGALFANSLAGISLNASSNCSAAPNDPSKASSTLPIEGRSVRYSQRAFLPDLLKHLCPLKRNACSHRRA